MARYRFTVRDLAPLRSLLDPPFAREILDAAIPIKRLGVPGSARRWSFRWPCRAASSRMACRCTRSLKAVQAEVPGGADRGARGQGRPHARGAAHGGAEAQDRPGTQDRRELMGCARRPPVGRGRKSRRAEEGAARRRHARCRVAARLSALCGRDADLQDPSHPNALPRQRKSKEFHDLTRAKPRCQIAEILPVSRKRRRHDGQAMLESFGPLYLLSRYLRHALPSPQLHPLAAPLIWRARMWAMVMCRCAGPTRRQRRKQIRFDVCTSADPSASALSGAWRSRGYYGPSSSGFTTGGDVYFTVITRRGAMLSLPSSILRVHIQPSSSWRSAIRGARRRAGVRLPRFGSTTRGGMSRRDGDSLLRGKILQLLPPRRASGSNLPEFGHAA